MAQPAQPALLKLKLKIYSGVNSQFAMDGEDAVVGDEANPLEVAPEGVMSQFAESLANLNIYSFYRLVLHEFCSV